MIKNKVPYYGHPISALLCVTFLTPLRSFKAYILNIPVILPVVGILLSRFLPQVVLFVIGTLVFLIMDMLILGFTDHNDLKYNFAAKYGNHKTAIFNLYELLVFGVVISLNTFLILKFFGGEIEVFYVLIAEAITIPWICAQFPLIRAINEYKCKKCRRANIMTVASRSKKSTHYEADYKTVWGHDEHIGTLTHNDTNIQVYQHVPTHKEFDGVSRVSTNREELECRCCGCRRTKFNYYRKKL